MKGGEWSTAQDEVCWVVRWAHQYVALWDAAVLVHYDDGDGGGLQLIACRLPAVTDLSIEHLSPPSELNDEDVSEEIKQSCIRNMH